MQRLRVIVLNHSFNGVIGVTYEDVRLIDTLCGSDGVVLSTVSGHHAGSEKRGGHCASAPVIVTKVSTAVGILMDLMGVRWWAVGRAAGRQVGWRQRRQVGGR